MFNINFYSFNKRNNSTKRPSASPSVFKCNIKTPSSILSPSIELNHSNPSNFNYCYIPEFKRYYFISNWTFNQGIWIASCNVDVLASYKESIGSSSLYVLRSASNYDGKIIDNKYPIKEGYSLNSNTFDIGNHSFQSGVYVINVVGTNANGGVITYELSPSNFKTLLDELLSYGDNQTLWQNVEDSIKSAVYEPLKYIQSIFWMPSSVGGTSVSSLSLGRWNANVNARIVNVTSGGVSGLNPLIWDLNIPKHPLANRGSYLNLSPFSEYILYCGAFGVIKLDSSALAECSDLTINIKIDPISAIAKLRVYAHNDGSNYTLVHEDSAQWGVQIGISQTNDGVAKGVVGVVGGVGGAILGVATGGISLIVGGAVASIGSLASIVTESEIRSKGSTGSLVDHTTPKLLQCRFFNIANEDASNLGKPLCSNVRISSLNGYILCETGKIEIDGYDIEKDEIEKYLTSGFYYE